MREYKYLLNPSTCAVLVDMIFINVFIFITPLATKLIKTNAWDNSKCGQGANF